MRRMAGDGGGAIARATGGPPSPSLFGSLPKETPRAGLLFGTVGLANKPNAGSGGVGADTTRVVGALALRRDSEHHFQIVRECECECSALPDSIVSRSEPSARVAGELSAWEVAGRNGEPLPSPSCPRSRAALVFERGLAAPTHCPHIGLRGRDGYGERAMTLAIAPRPRRAEARQVLSSFTRRTERAAAAALCVAAASCTPPSPSARMPERVPAPPLPTRWTAAPGPAAWPGREALPPVLLSRRGGAVWGEQSWGERRREMRALLEHYALGHAPPSPQNVAGVVLEQQTLNEGTVSYRRVRLEFGPERALHLEVGLFVPLGRGPVPAVVFPAGTPPGGQPLPRQPYGPGQGQGVDALAQVGPGVPPTPAPEPRPLDAAAIARDNPALRHGFAYVVFNHNDCGEDTTLREADGRWAFRRTRFYAAYPDYDWGLLAGWAWGFSRIIDFLEQEPLVDSTKLMVTGFSRTGKAALVAGAFDERIALTAPVASGGGGVGAYRRSGAGRGGKEGLDLMLRKYPNWFSPHLLAFKGQTERLPFDQHWLLALVAPRALLALESEHDPVSLEPAVKQSILAAKPAYAFLGYPERLGVHYAEREHAFTAEDWAALLAFADRHLLAKPAARRFDQFPSDHRLPHNQPKPDASRVRLFNGRDLTGWSVYLDDKSVDPAGVWSVSGGVLRLDAPVNGYLRTRESYADYHLHVEWRWPEQPGKLPNSGVMLHLNGPDVIWPSSYEAQLKHLNAGQFVGMGLEVESAPLLARRKRSARFAASTEAPRGRWNTYDIYCERDAVDTFVNGVRQNYAANLSVSAGAIALQMEGYPIELRNVWLQPLN